MCKEGEVKFTFLSSAKMSLPRLHSIYRRGRKKKMTTTRSKSSIQNLEFLRLP